MKDIVIYHIYPHYRAVEFWVGDGNGQRIMTRTVRALESSRRNRFSVIQSAIISEGLKAPKYEAKEAR